MNYVLISFFVLGVLFSVLCGICFATMCVAFGAASAAPLCGICFGVLVCAVYTLIGLRSYKKMKAKAPSFEVPPAFCAEVSVHFLEEAFRGVYSLNVFSDVLCFFSPTAPDSMKNLTFQKESISMDRILVSVEGEEPKVFDLLLYKEKVPVAQIHTRARYRTALEQTLEALGYFEAPLPQMVEVN